MATNEGVIEAVEAAFGAAFVDAVDSVGEVTVTVVREGLVAAMTALRDTPGLEYQQLMEIAGVDYPERPERFEVVYHLLSLTKNRRIRVRSEEHTSELQSLMRISYAVFCLNNKKITK